MTGVVIRMTHYEMVAANAVAVSRMTASRHAKLDPTRSVGPRAWLEQLRQEMVGSTAEMAVAKWLGIYYGFSVDTFSNVPDVGNLDVRATAMDNGSLILRDNDYKDRVYVLACVSQREATDVRIAGWIVGNAGMKDEYKRNPHGQREAWFVPQHALNPPEVLTVCKEVT